MGLESGTRHVSFGESIWRKFVSVVCFESPPNLGNEKISEKKLQYLLNDYASWLFQIAVAFNLRNKILLLKNFAKFAIVHLEPNAVKVTHFKYEYHCNHYLPRSGHKKSGHTKLRHRTRSHLGVPLIKKDVSAVLIRSMWNIPRNETPNMEDIFVRVVCIDLRSQCDNGWDRSCGTNNHIPRTYRPRQHPHFAAALHTFINF